MKQKEFVNFIASSFAVAAATINQAEAISSNSVDETFSIQPRSIDLYLCQADDLSIKSITTMVQERNDRDKNISRSTTDRQTHL